MRSRSDRLDDLAVSPDVAYVLTAVTDRCRSGFADLVDSVYLTGSQLDGSATRGSDIDLVVIVRDGVSRDDVLRINAALSAIPAGDQPEVGSLFLSARDLAHGVPEYARTARPILGTGRLADAPPIDDAAAFRGWSRGSLWLSAKARGVEGGMMLPLTVPDIPPYGFPIPVQNGRATTKRFVSLVARMAGALLILRGAGQPSGKSACIRAYATLEDGPFGEWVAAFHEALNRRWEYDVPPTEEERAELTRRLRELPRFENHFVDEIRERVLGARGSSDEKEAAWATSCLDLVRMDDDPAPEARR